jgi:hypothetical protein
MTFREGFLQEFRTTLKEFLGGASLGGLCALFMAAILGGVTIFAVILLVMKIIFALKL